MAMTMECVELLATWPGYIERYTSGCSSLSTAGRPRIVASLRRKPRALLRAESIYDKAHVTVTPYEEGKVSLPGSVRDSRYADAIGGGARPRFAREVHRTASAEPRGGR